jgi:hypothetical protein
MWKYRNGIFFFDWFMVFNAINNISVISWKSVLLVEKTTDLSQVNDKIEYGVWTHNVSGDWHWLHRKMEIQLPYNHNHYGPRCESTWMDIFYEIKDTMKPI